MCAIDRGRAIDTTMGFSPQSGLENATRHGDLDVFAVLFMMERQGWSAEEVRRQLASEGGLAGLSGIAGGDVRDLEASATEAARRALAVFAYQVKKTIGAYAARWADSTPSPSPAASAKTPPRCARPVARVWNFWASGSTPRKMKTAGVTVWSPRPNLRWPFWRWLPTRSSS